MIGLMLSQVKFSDAAKYSLLPQVAPRLNQFFSEGFSNLAYLMVLIYQSVRLIPPNHPYLQSNYHGKYTIRQVMGVAASNLKFDKDHIDQVIIFFALIAGMIILAFQFIFMLSFMMIDPAFAQEGLPSSYGDFLQTTTNNEDIALKMLALVFGLPDFFGANGVIENDFHRALRGIFQIYSIALLVIAALLIIYFIFSVVAETAQTGTPFGKRYNHVWAPIRLVVAIGLLIPISEGLNSGQWITLYAAKWGSGFATNGWNKFNETLNDTYIPSEEIIARPNIQEKDFRDMAAFFMVAHACKRAYEIADPNIGNNIDAYLVKGQDGGQALLMSNVLYSQAIDFIGSSKNIRIRIGMRNNAYKQHTGSVYAHCGEITMTVPNQPISENDAGDTTLRGGSGLLNARYFALLKRFWDANITDYSSMRATARSFINARLISGSDNVNISTEIKTITPQTAKTWIEDALDDAIELEISQYRKPDPSETEKYGWGGAGIFYKKIADMNGQLVFAALNKPQITTMPSAMAEVCDKNKQQNNNTSTQSCYSPDLAEGRKLVRTDILPDPALKALSEVYDYWYKDPEDVSGNIFIDTINLILGTNALFDMCENSETHPLAQLSTLGKGLVDASIRNFGFGIAGGIGSMFVGQFGPALSAASGFATSIASITILLGFILFYIIPFLPFLYFLFAVGGWVKGLFEAMVGVPLWALAHIRIDGEGLPGDAAAGGYFLIFEIFIRPILIIFGLLASLLIFSAMIKVLNEIFHLAVSNLSGFNPASEELCGKKLTGGSTPPTGSIDYFRGPVDQFFFTIVYAILVYMTGMSSFKLIDMIPNQILRWTGQGLATFNDSAGEPADGIVQKMAIGGGLLGQVTGEIGGGLQQSVKSGATGVQNLVNPKQ